ncbi:MAG: SHOCT domain-containing protein [Lewinella sp.]
MEIYDSYHFGGMHLLWWFVWMILIVWIFATPYRIPGQRSGKGTPLDVLKMRFASGLIDQQEYLDKKKLLQ